MGRHPKVCMRVESSAAGPGMAVPPSPLACLVHASEARPVTSGGA